MDTLELIVMHVLLLLSERIVHLCVTELLMNNVILYSNAQNHKVRVEFERPIERQLPLRQFMKCNSLYL